MFHRNVIVPIEEDTEETQENEFGEGNFVSKNNDLPSEARKSSAESRRSLETLHADYEDAEQSVGVTHSPQPLSANGFLKRRNSYLLNNEKILQDLASTGDSSSSRRKESVVAYTYAILETELEGSEPQRGEEKRVETSDDGRESNGNDKDFERSSTESSAMCKCEADPNQTLLQYFAKLSSSSDIHDYLDLEHIKSLLHHGASVNTSDRFGQTLLHEVSRTWEVEVAEFFIEQGADVNKADDYGRTPLHVAAAADYPEMVRFLLDNGANFKLTTKGEVQTPLHFAARNEAAKCVRIFLAYGASSDVRDYKQRTPLQLAAETNSAESARILMEAGASAGTTDDSGMSALTLMVTKMPSVALRALDHFHVTDRPHRKQRYYLNFLERCDADTKKSLTCTSPLQAVVEMNCFELIMHPIFQRLLEVKWGFYGRWAWFGIFLNVLLAVAYTILGVTHPLHVDTFYSPLKKNGWRIPLEVVVVILTFNEIIKEVKEIYQSRKENNQWIKWRKNEVKRDLEFCHPRWTQERTFIKQQIRQIKGRKKTYFQDKWNFLDWVVYVMLLIVFVLHVVNVMLGSQRYSDVFIRIMACTLILVWVRLLKFARPFPSQGPFVVILDNILVDTVRWGFVIAMFYIPYAAAFYMMFGDRSRTPVRGYDSFVSLTYTIIRYPLVDNYGFDDLANAAPIMARVLCGSFLLLAAIILMNLYIALLSNTFQRVYDNARATAAMQRARLLQDLEANSSGGKVARYREHIRNRCSPEGSDYLVIISDEEEQNRKQEEKISMVHNIVSDRLGGKKFGKVQKSEFDMVLEDIELLKKSQGEVKSILERLHLELQDIKTFHNTLLGELAYLKTHGQQQMLAISEVSTSLSDMKTHMDSEILSVKDKIGENLQNFEMEAKLRDDALESSICTKVDLLHSEFDKFNMRFDADELELRARVEELEAFIVSKADEEAEQTKRNPAAKHKAKGGTHGLFVSDRVGRELKTVSKSRPSSGVEEGLGVPDRGIRDMKTVSKSRQSTPEEGLLVADPVGRVLKAVPKSRPSSGVEEGLGVPDHGSRGIETVSESRPSSGISEDVTNLDDVDKGREIEKSKETQRKRTITMLGKEARDQYIAKLKATFAAASKQDKEENDNN